MKLKSTLLAAAALSALAATSQAQMAANSPMPSDAVPVVPGMAPGTTPGFVRVDPAVTPNPAPGVPADQMMMQTPTTTQMMPGTPMPATQMMAPGMMANGMMMMSAQDQLFCARAAEGNLAEITFARLALDKSRNDNVRQTANVILQGHTKAQNDLMALMRSMNMNTGNMNMNNMNMSAMMTPKLSAPHMVVYDALSRAKGDTFDKMYMAGQTVDHENTIALFATQINAGQNDALKNYANMYLPDIVGHTILIYNVARQVNAPGSELRPMLPPIPPGVSPMLMMSPIDMTNYQTITNSINAQLMRMPMPRM